jgi:hypothetical protein
MSQTLYTFPVNQLLALGDVRDETHWPDYLAYGLDTSHILELIRMGTDEELQWADSESVEVWAPVHAWRALGQLRAEAAIEPLLGLLKNIDEEDDDWADTELPKVFGLIGPAAIPALTAYLTHSETEGTSTLAPRRLIV